MASRSKRQVKQRSKAHQKKVKTARRRKKQAHPKVGYGTKKRRAKKAAKRVTKKSAKKATKRKSTKKST